MRLALAGVTLLMALVFGYGASVAPERAALSYLVGVTYWTTVLLGVLLLVLMAHASPMRWLVVFRRLCEVLCVGLVPLAFLFVPVLMFADLLYPWAREGTSDPHVAHLIEHRHAYLNRGFVAVRTILYFGLWVLFALSLLRASLRRDEVRDTKPKTTLASAGLVVYALSLTLASFDWWMSLDARFVSTAFGVYIFAGAFISGLALLGLGALATPMSELGLALRPSHFSALGRLVFAFTIFWAYIGYAQFFIIYMGDMPEEVGWMGPRILGPWGTWAWVLLLGHFVIPFLVLLPRGAKTRRRVLGGMCLLLLVCHAIDILWLILPSRLETPSMIWLDVVSILGVGALTGLVVDLWTRNIALLPKGDPGLPASLEYVAR